MHLCRSKILIRSRTFLRGLAPAFILIAPVISAAQGRTVSRLPAPSSLPVVSSLTELARSAGYIFSGTVASVERVAASSSSEVATMRVTFRVGQAIRGTQTGQTLVIHEWAGLWDSGPRYRPGERILLFLYPASRLGLTSPVGGPMGRFAMDRNGQVILNEMQASALRVSPVAPILRPGALTIITPKDLARAAGLPEER